MMIARLAGLSLGLLASFSAFAQTWKEPRDISPTESPIDLKITGWGKSAVKRAVEIVGETNDLRRDATINVVVASAQNYLAVVHMNEAYHFVHWEQDTVQNIAQKLFGDKTLEFGKYQDVSHGSADFRWIPTQVTEKGTTNHCAVFRAHWERYMSQGYLCALGGKPLPESAPANFITHIAYKNALVPKDEGTLPTP
ncbi:MAG: hypothetical protein ACOVKO_02485 [Elstera sp.]